MKKKNSKSERSKVGLNSTTGQTTEFKSNMQAFCDDYEEEWERNSDFIKKFRTVHP